MTASEYATGCGFLLVWVGAPAAAAVLLRRRLLPGWTGAPALLVDVLSTLALLLTVAQLLGTVGGLTRPGLTAGCLLVGVAGLLLALRAPARPASDLARQHEPAWSRFLGLASVAAVVGLWASKTRFILEIGNFDTDSLVYHWPYAAVFAQSGWTTRLHLGAPGAGASWHAANGELLGGISILAFHRDWMLPLLNFGWLALALLAARVVGRRSGTGGLATAVACVLFAVPILARSQGGSGFTDIASLALVLAAIALLLEAFESSGLTPLLWSGAAAGLAASTKETTLATGGLLAVAVLVLCLRSGRASAFVLWAAPAVLLGSFWYVRNLVREGNPIPTSDLGPLRSIAGPFIETYGYSVAHFLPQGHVIRHTFVPGLLVAWGLFWPVLVGSVLLAAGLTLRRATPARYRLLAGVGVLGLAFYLVTPTTAFGFKDLPVLFPQNTRYALPSMLVLAVLLVRHVGGGRARLALGASALVTLLATIATRGDFPTLLPQRGGQALFMAVVALVILTVAPVLAERLGRPLVLGLAVALALPMLFVVGRDYVQNRYPASAGDASRTFAWANEVHRVSIGVDGVSEEYPYTGNDVSNRVSYIGVRDAQRVFGEAPTCQIWRRAVNAGGYDFLVIGPHLNGSDLPAASRWVDPLAMPSVLSAGAYHVYRVTGPLDPATC